MGVAVRGPAQTDKVVRPFVTHFAEVEVNKRTGEVRVVRMLAAHDSGRVMNLLTYRNQVFGGFIMGLGFGMTERRILDPTTGKMANANWHDYKIPTAKDVPADMTLLPIDPARHRVQHHRHEGNRRTGHDSHVPRPSPTRSITRPACVSRRRPSRRRRFSHFWPNARQKDEPCLPSSHINEQFRLKRRLRRRAGPRPAFSRAGPTCWDACATECSRRTAWSASTTSKSSKASARGLGADGASER